jgi:tripartite-type tricarboxylate transporter receptor subunit TctC
MKRLLAFAVLALTCLQGPSQAQRLEGGDWPKQPVRFVTPFPPGSGAETLLRVVADRLSQEWKTATYIENRPGGNTIIAATALTGSPADGYTFLFTTDDTVTSIQYLNPTLPFDPQKDLVPVTLLATTYLTLVTRGDAPFDSLADLVKVAKAKPGSVSVSTLGPASSHQLLSDLLAAEAGVSLLSVPYKGIPAAVLATLSGEVDLTWANTFAIQDSVAARKLKVLAVTGPVRHAGLPNVPTFAEAGFPKVDLPTHFGVFARAGTPIAIVERLNSDLQGLLSDPAFRRDVIESRGFRSGGDALGAFERLLREEGPRRAALLKKQTAVPQPASAR